LYELRNDGSVAALTLLRVGVGLILVAHGWQKLSDVSGTIQAFAAMGVPAPAVATWLAIAGEFFGGLGLALGLLTPLSALGTGLVMVFAIAFVHMGKGLFAQQGGWEYPLTLLLVSVFFIARGAGPISADEVLRQARAGRTRTPPPFVERVERPI
jgi:putative oxidoreductase